MRKKLLSLVMALIALAANAAGRTKPLKGSLIQHSADEKAFRSRLAFHAEVDQSHDGNQRERRKRDLKGGPGANADFLVDHQEGIRHREGGQAGGDADEERLNEPRSGLAHARPRVRGDRPGRNGIFLPISAKC
jgi:hypothetical protein